MSARKMIGRITAVSLLMALTTGCEVLRVHQTVERVDTTAEEAAGYAAALRDPKLQGKPANAVKFQDAPLVDLKPLVTTTGIPAHLDCPITFDKTVDVMIFAQLVTRTCNIAVRVTPDVFDGGARNSGGAAPAQAGTPAAPSDISGLFPGGAVAGGGAQTFSAGSTRNTQLRGLKYEGRLSGLLNQVTAQLGLSWKFSAVDRAVTIFYLDTRTFNFYAFASTTDMQSVVQSGTTSAAGTGSGSSSSGASSGISGYSGSSQSTTLSLKTSIADDIEQNVKTMLSPVGRMALSRSTGMITVTDRPEILDQVGTYLDAENVNITKQVLLNVKVYSVTLSDKDNLGIDWNLIYKASNGNWNFNLENTFQDAATNAISGQVGILDGSFAGSTAVVKALAEQGRVSVVTSPSVTTLNLQPVPVQVARQTGYLASIQTTNTPDVGSSTSLTPGTVTSGFNMDLLPFVMPNNELLLQYSINISTLIRLRAESSGDNRIQVPEIDNRIFSQKVRLRSGETLVLSGFDQTAEQGTKAGTGSSWNFLMGGGVNRDSTRDVIVVLITPVIKG
jgi:type IVB pilus formation R64 PilN family outer membrane protein